MRISDWSSDVCASDLRPRGRRIDDAKVEMRIERGKIGINVSQRARIVGIVFAAHAVRIDREAGKAGRRNIVRLEQRLTRAKALEVGEGIGCIALPVQVEEQHTMPGISQHPRQVTSDNRLAGAALLHINGNGLPALPTPIRLVDRKSKRSNSSHYCATRMTSPAWKKTP